MAGKLAAVRGKLARNRDPYYFSYDPEPARELRREYVTIIKRVADLDAQRLQVEAEQ